MLNLGSTKRIPKKTVQPGGTMVLVSGATVETIKESGSDNLGRWSWKSAGDERGTSFISAYTSCKPSSAGATTVWVQLRRASGVADIDPHKQILTDLVPFIKT